MMNAKAELIDVALKGRDSPALSIHCVDSFATTILSTIVATRCEFADSQRFFHSSVCCRLLTK